MATPKTPKINPQSDPTLFVSISDQWLAIQPEYSRLRAACTTKAQQDDLDQRYTDMETAYWAAVRTALVDKNKTVEEIAGDLSELTKELKEDLKKLQDIAKVIKLIGQGAKLAASLVTLAGI